MRHNGELNPHYAVIVMPRGLFSPMFSILLQFDSVDPETAHVVIDLSPAFSTTAVFSEIAMPRGLLSPMFSILLQLDSVDPETAHAVIELVLPFVTNA